MSTTRTFTPPTESTSQLLIWIYQTDISKLTLAEKLEKANWECARLEKL